MILWMLDLQDNLCWQRIQNKGSHEKQQSEKELCFQVLRSIGRSSVHIPMKERIFHNLFIVSNDADSIRCRFLFPETAWAQHTRSNISGDVAVSWKVAKRIDNHGTRKLLKSRIKVLKCVRKTQQCMARILQNYCQQKFLFSWTVLLRKK